MGRGGCVPAVALLAAAVFLTAAAVTANQPGSDDGGLNVEIGQRRGAQPTWPVSTFTGGGSGGDGGPATAAVLYDPTAVVVAKQSQGGAVYFAETANNKIRVVVNGNISTYAGNGAARFSGDGGPASNAGLNYPSGIALDPISASITMYIADQNNNRVRKVSNNFIVTERGETAQASGGTAGQPRAHI